MLFLKYCGRRMGQVSGLLTRVIEFSGLANGETTTSNDQDLLHINEILAAGNGAARKISLCVGRDLGIAGSIAEL